MYRIMDAYKIKTADGSTAYITEQEYKAVQKISSIPADLVTVKASMSDADFLANATIKEKTSQED